ncbi:hypothetical protein HanPI659440_Chr05g0206151 [Helianthus annuus]|nr:hypothetical protein HanPI659440_Chr05g0206151 [Helianthus annuus]
MNVQCLRHMHERYQSVRLWDRWLHEEMELDLDKSIKKALGQFHDYFIECSTKLHYIV